jgi:3-carboxy-cis,cis-muconate cycloisomerase
VAELRRHRVRLLENKPRVLTGQFGGAVGTLASVSAHGLEINARLMQELGLNVPEIAWHTTRDNFAEFAGILCMICATLGKIAHEIIDLQKLEFGEVEEPFEMGKIGSSTMPQKRNPMICEAILAIARLARTKSTTAMDSMFHEHERDWASVHMEWAYLPELCVMTHGALCMTQYVLAGLVVYPANMARNLNVTHGSLLSERVMLALGKFVGRQQAHDIIYAAAMESFEQQAEFSTVLKGNAAVTAHLSPETIDSLLDPAQYTGLAGIFVDRVTGR